MLSSIHCWEISTRPLFERNAVQSRQVTGWVRNCPDRRVEFEAQGEQTDIENFLQQLRMGPSLAQVTAVQTVQLTAIPGETGFKIRYF